MWFRVHRTPRSSLFSPFLEDEQTGPRRGDVKMKRETHAFNMETVEVKKIKDIWTTLVARHEGHGQWVGYTSFYDVDALSTSSPGLQCPGAQSCRAVAAIIAKVGTAATTT